MTKVSIIQLTHPKVAQPKPGASSLPLLNNARLGQNQQQINAIGLDAGAQAIGRGLIFFKHIFILLSFLLWYKFIKNYIYFFY